MHDEIKMWSLVNRRFHGAGNSAQEMDWTVEFLESGKISLGHAIAQKLAADALEDEGARLLLSESPIILNALKFLVPDRQFSVQWEPRGAEFAAFVAARSGAGMGAGYTVVATVASGWKPPYLVEGKTLPFVGTTIWYRRK
jgi:hypothetical protein